MKIVFPYIAQLHQIPHSLPIAVELAQRHPEVEVHLAYVAAEQLSFIRRFLDACAPGVPLHCRRLAVNWLDPLRLAPGRRHSKKLTLLTHRAYFAGFDGVVTPEQTSLFLRYLGLSRTRLIWTRHGAGDRGIGFGKRTRHFDFVLMAGRKIERRLLAQRLIRPGDYAVGVYAKFDWVRRLHETRPRLFDNSRPTVLYNPHFRPELSSWPLIGRQVLDALASSSRYNLIFAPHIRLFDGAGAGTSRLFDRYRGLPHVHVDLGSERSVDMSYTAAADIYLGDVSSQVAEFVSQPRPCLFLNPREVSWHNDLNYASWSLGPVSPSVADLERWLDHAVATHDRYVAVQRRYFSDSFDIDPETSSAALGADAIVEFLRRPRTVDARDTPVATTAMRAT